MQFNQLRGNLKESSEPSTPSRGYPLITSTDSREPAECFLLHCPQVCTKAALSSPRSRRDVQGLQRKQDGRRGGRRSKLRSHVWFHLFDLGANGVNKSTNPSPAASPGV